MTVCTIEISDVAVRVLAPDRVLSETPGFAIVQPDELLIGSRAEALRRRHPRQVVSGFWTRLSMDALPVTGHKARTWADLAFAQLHNAWADADAPTEKVVFAVPAGFGRDRLAVLLGVAEHCPFAAVGLTEMPLAAAAAVTDGDPKTLVDVSLTSTVAVPLVKTGDEIQCGELAEFADCGLASMQNAWVAHIADQFIRETRFDPLFDAANEQYLYEQLPAWQAALRDSARLEIELSSAGTTHRINLDRGPLLAADKPRWQPLVNQLRGSGEVVLTRQAALVNGLAEALAESGLNVSQLDHLASARGVAANEQRIRQRPADGGISLTVTLPVANGGALREPPTMDAAAPAPVAEKPAPAVQAVDPAAATHILVGCDAWPISDDTLHIGRWPEIGDDAPAGRWASTVGLPKHLCDVTHLSGQVVLRNHHSAGTSVNGVNVQGEHPLSAGDRIEAPETGISLQAIKVLVS